METKTFNKAELQEFINSPSFNELINIPISRRRAISQIHNPRAEDEDILLVAAFDGNKTVGYLGILPDFVIQGNTKEKVAKELGLSRATLYRKLSELEISE